MHAALILAKERNNLEITYLKSLALRNKETNTRLKHWIRQNRDKIWEEYESRHAGFLADVEKEDIEIGVSSFPFAHPWPSLGY